VEHPRVGALLPEAVAGLLADPATLVRLARLDPDGTIHTDPHRHDPSAALRRAVQARDGTCRFPGCHTPAHRCDIDHVIAFPHGPTRLDNLVCLCRRHHRFKHHGGWTPTLTPDGVLLWRTPDGRAYPTHPHGGRTLTDLGLPTQEAEPHYAVAAPRGNGNGEAAADTALLAGPGNTADDRQAGVAGRQPAKVAAAGHGNPGPATRQEGATPAEVVVVPSPLEEHLTTVVTLPHRPAPHHAKPHHAKPRHAKARYDLHLPRPGDPPISLVA
jgi:hypothetical protein